MFFQKKKTEILNKKNCEDMMGCRTLQKKEKTISSDFVMGKTVGKIFQRMASIMEDSTNIVSIFLIDHFYLLIKSAAENHLRIQQCKVRPIEGEVCNLTFGSYIELKKYQKKVRLLTFSTSSTMLSVFVAIMVVQLFFPGLRSQGATFVFNQTSWSGGATANGANHASNQTGWNQYQSKDANIAVVNSGNDLQLTLPTAQSVQDDTDAQFNGTQTGDGFYTDGSGKLYLKKPTTAACTLAAQCASGICTGNVCQ